MWFSQDAVVFKDETVHAQVIRLTDPAIPASLNDDFDGVAGYKSFSEDNNYFTRYNGNFFCRRIVFATESARWPHAQLTKGGCGPTSYYRPPPAPLDDLANRTCIARLFGQCNGPNTTVRVRDLLQSKPSAPGVTILEAGSTPLKVSGSTNGTVAKWPRQNHFTSTKKGARLSYVQRSSGVFGPELRELSNAHVYVLTVYVAGYNVLGMPVPQPEGLPQGVKRMESDSDDSFMEDMSDLNVSTPRSEPSKKKIKVEPVEQEGVTAPKPPKGVAVGSEVRALDALAAAAKKTSEGELFEVSHTSTLRMYIYKQTTNKA